MLRYRTGLDIEPSASASFVETENAVANLLLQYEETGSLRLQQKILNDLLVRTVLRIAGQFNKPGRSRIAAPYPNATHNSKVQFHTGEDGICYGTGN